MNSKEYKGVSYSWDFDFDSHPPKAKVKRKVRKMSHKICRSRKRNELIKLKGDTNDIN